MNGKRYVGITSQRPENRWGVNGNNYKNKCPHFWNAIQKYGWDNFDHLVVERHLSKEDACAMEIELIRIFNTQDRNHGYNTMSGGTAPSIPKEVRDKMSLSMMGNKNGLGHPCTDEKKRKISEAQKGRRLTKEHREKLSRAKAGVHRGTPREETRRKISNSHKKAPVYCEETNTVYPSIQECARQLGLQATNVCRCCKGKLKSTGGFHLSYHNNTINA